jgi:dTDP-4-amino-4,6-dideoxygalactose transaminase
MADQLRVRFAFPTCSGRVGLWAILKALRRLRRDRDIVALPAYTCFSVPASIVRAGLKLYPIDIDPETLDFDYAQLSSLPEKGLLCVLASHLFGFVNDVARIQQIALAKGAFLIDDAAQALGATRDGRPAGTWGDVGFYSFGRGKPLGSVEGGLIVTASEELAAALQGELEVLAPPPALHSAEVFLQLLAYSILLRPRLYWMPNSIPFLKLGTTEYDPNFRICKFAGFSERLFPLLMEKLVEINGTRRKNAASLADAVSGNPDFLIPKAGNNCQPTYIRFPLIARDRSVRDRAVLRLQAGGIGASPFYPSAICDIPRLAPHMAVRDFHRPRAEDLSSRLLTLPTHPFVRPEDLDRMVSVLNTF